MVATGEKKLRLLTEKSYQLIQKKKMQHISKLDLQAAIGLLQEAPGFNLYRFIKDY